MSQKYCNERREGISTIYREQIPPLVDHLLPYIVPHSPYDSLSIARVARAVIALCILGPLSHSSTLNHCIISSLTILMEIVS